MASSYLPPQQLTHVDVHQTASQFCWLSSDMIGAQVPPGYNEVNSFYDGADLMYLLGYEHFRTKDEVGSRCRQIIAITQEGKPVSHWFVPFLHDLFSFHDDWQELVEIITGITVFENYQGAKCFSIMDSWYRTHEISIK